MISEGESNSDLLFIAFLLTCIASAHHLKVDVSIVPIFIEDKKIT